MTPRERARGIALARITLPCIASVYGIEVLQGSRVALTFRAPIVTANDNDRALGLRWLRPAS
jgi:hypothetical protein